MSSIQNSAVRLPEQLPSYLSMRAAARLAGLRDVRRIGRNVEPDAWELGPNGKRWPLYTPETIESWVASKKAAQQ